MHTSYILVFLDLLVKSKMKDEIQNKLITLLFRLHFLSYFTHRWQSKLEVRLEISFLEQQPNIDGEKMLWELLLVDSNISQLMCLVILLTFLLDHTSIFLGEIKWWWLLQVPFIANYRKEYIEPELNIEDLWKIWEWDEKVLLKSNNFFVAFFFFCILSHVHCW